MTQALGLAMRAQKLVIGTELVIKGLQNNKIKLVVLSKSASNNTKKLVTDKSSYYKVKVIEIDDFDLNNSIGKTNIKVLGVVDDGFKEMLLRKKGM